MNPNTKALLFLAIGLALGAVFVWGALTAVGLRRKVRKATRLQLQAAQHLDEQRGPRAAP